jgi:hypothetical protein
MRKAELENMGQQLYVRDAAPTIAMQRDGLGLGIALKGGSHNCDVERWSGAGNRLKGTIAGESQT